MDTSGELGTIHSEGEQIGGFFGWSITPKLIKNGVSDKGNTEYICRVCQVSVQSWWLFKYTEFCKFKFYWSRNNKLILAGEWKGFLPELMREGADGHSKNRPISTIELEVR